MALAWPSARAPRPRSAGRRSPGRPRSPGARRRPARSPPPGQPSTAVPEVVGSPSGDRSSGSRRPRRLGGLGVPTADGAGGAVSGAATAATASHRPRVGGGAGAALGRPRRPGGRGLGLGLAHVGGLGLGAGGAVGFSGGEETVVGGLVDPGLDLDVGGSGGRWVPGRPGPPPTCRGRRPGSGSSGGRGGPPPGEAAGAGARQQHPRWRGALTAGAAAGPAARASSTAAAAFAAMASLALRGRLQLLGSNRALLQRVRGRGPSTPMSSGWSISWVRRSTWCSAYSNSGLQWRASNGHTSTQMPQYMQRAKSIANRSRMLRVRARPPSLGRTCSLWESM
jgi:hypothetical protein